MSRLVSGTTLRFVVAAAVAAASASVAAIEKWGPTWSEVTGNLWSRVQMNREPAVISKVDGKSETRRVVKVESGKRTITVRSPMRKGFSGSNVTMELDLEPCQRYYINAQFKSGSGPDWEPIVAKVEPIAGCKKPS